MTVAAASLVVTTDAEGVPCIVDRARGIETLRKSDLRGPAGIVVLARYERTAADIDANWERVTAGIPAGIYCSSMNLTRGNAADQCGELVDFAGDTCYLHGGF
jgi:hypothetical protein